MLSIQSAGYNDPILYGPQMSLATSSWWDMKAVSDLEFLTYSYNTNFPMFGYFSTGDTLYLYRMPADFNAQAWMMVSDADLGRTDRTATLEWPLIFTSVGGVNDLLPYDLRNDYRFGECDSNVRVFSCGGPDNAIHQQIPVRHFRRTCTTAETNTSWLEAAGT